MFITNNCQLSIENEVFMLYYLFNYLDQLDLPGAGMFKYVSFRSGLALILSLFISTAIGRRIIDRLQLLQIGETVRNLGLEGQMSKKGTPTMGGIIIIIAILIPTLLCAKLNNIYVILIDGDDRLAGCSRFC